MSTCPCQNAGGHAHTHSFHPYLLRQIFDGWRPVVVQFTVYFLIRHGDFRSLQALGCLDPQRLVLLRDFALQPIDNNPDFSLRTLPSRMNRIYKSPLEL